MDGYKSTETNFYQENVPYSFQGGLNAHLPQSKWEFKLWNKESLSFDWKGNLEELAEVILAGQAVLEQQKQPQEVE